MRAAHLVRFLLLLPLLTTGCEKLGSSGSPTPPLVASLPPAGAVDVPTTAWFFLDFAGAVGPGYRVHFDLVCVGDSEPRLPACRDHVDRLAKLLAAVTPLGPQHVPRETLRVDTHENPRIRVRSTQH